MSKPCLVLAIVLCLAFGGRLAAADPIDELLATQASALERFDIDAYLSTFVPERRDAERRIFLRCRPLPLTEVHMAAAGGGRPPTDSDRIQREVELIFRLDGQPADNPFVHALTYDFSRIGGDWLVGEIVDDRSRPLPWRQGDFEVHRTNHFLIYTRPEMRADLVELAADAEAGYAMLYSRRLPLAASYLIHFAAGREFGRRSGGLSALGVAVSRNRLVAGRYEVHSRMFYVNSALFSASHRRRLAPDVRRITVAHELVHLALASQSRPFTPPWLKEGAAVYFSGDFSFDANRDLVRGGLDDLSLEAMTRARVLGQQGHIATAGQQAAEEYLFSGNVVAYLIETQGQDRFLDLYRSYAELPPERVMAALGSLGHGSVTRVFESAAGNLATEVTGETLQRIYGLTLEELEAEVKQWLGIRHR